MTENEPIKPINPGLGIVALRVIKVCLILSCIAVFAAVMMGTSTVAVQQETINNQSFIKVAKEMRPNFEESLSLYTGSTQKIVNFLLALRPSTEEEFITFISRLEDLGQDLSLNLDIKSVDTSETDTSNKKKKTKDNFVSIAYEVNFYGSIRDMKALIDRLDDMPYYIEISQIRYSNPAFVDEPLDNDNQFKKASSQNISLIIKLFTKNQNAT